MARLPANPDAERAVLGAVMLDNAVWPQASGLASDDFFLDSHRVIFRRMLALALRNSPIDLVGLAEEVLRNGEMEGVGGPAFLSSLTDGLPRSANIEHYARIVKDKSILRRQFSLAQAIMARALDASERPETIARDALAGFALPAAKNGHAAPGVLISDVRREEVSWLWNWRIPLGKLTFLDGDPGQGKSLLALEIAAALSRGLALPGESNRTEGGAVILTAEDGLGDTVRPRLEVARADLGRIVALPYLPEKPGGDSFSSLQADLPLLERAIERVRARLVIFDVLFAYLPNAETNVNRDQDVRLALAPLVEMAARRQVAILAIRHLNKKPGGSALYRGGGSIGLIGAARAGLLAAPDPENADLHILAQTKTNLGPLQQSLTYRIVAESGVARISWEGTSEQTASALLNQHDDDDETLSAKGEAAEFLMEELAGGALAVTEIFNRARRAGIAEKTLRRAGRDLGVEKAKAGMKGGWVWALPDSAKMAKTSEDGQGKTLGTFRETWPSSSGEQSAGGWGEL